MRRISRLVAVIGVGVVLAGCQDSTLDLSSQSTARVVVGPSVPVAVSAIEGLPETLAPRFSSALAAEAQARQISFADTGSEPRFRIKGYINAFASESGNTISWVWDVFDVRARRAQRVAGQQVIGRAGDAWTSVDDKVLRFVASRSLDEIGQFLAAHRQDTPVAARPSSPTARAAARAEDAVASAAD